MFSELPSNTSTMPGVEDKMGLTVREDGVIPFCIVWIFIFKDFPHINYTSIFLLDLPNDKGVFCLLKVAQLEPWFLN